MTLTQHVRNGWYLGAWSDEIGRTLKQRWITDIPVCFYRLPDQTVTAVEDRCPHRKYPLSLGHLDDEGTLQCDYHGYRFDGQGVCVGVAEQADRPKAALRRFPWSSATVPYGSGPATPNWPTRASCPTPRG